MEVDSAKAEVSEEDEEVEQNNYYEYTPPKYEEVEDIASPQDAESSEDDNHSAYTYSGYSSKNHFVMLAEDPYVTYLRDQANLSDTESED